MRALVLVLILAAGASAASVQLLRSWRIPDTGTATLVNVSEEPDGKVRLRLFGQSAVTFRWADFSREEAASLGRALLEAAGQPEKVCQSGIIIGPHSGTLQLDGQWQNPCPCGGVTNSVPGAKTHCLPCFNGSTTLECTPEKCPGAYLGAPK